MPGTGAPTHGHRLRFQSRLKLTRAAEFEAVFKNGRRSTDSLFTVLYHPSGLGHARLGMTTPAKRLPTAVQRNRIRRAIRESFRHAERRVTGLDIVILVKEPANRATNAAIFASLADHWAQLQTADAGA